MYGRQPRSWMPVYAGIQDLAVIPAQAGIQKPYVQRQTALGHARHGVRGEGRQHPTHLHDLVAGFPQRRAYLLDTSSAQEREVLCRGSIPPQSPTTMVRSGNRA